MGKNEQQRPDMDAETSLFKKKLKELSAFKGRGTELISLYIPSGTDRSIVMNQLTQEMSQSSNIKSPQTRKNVQGALRRISNFLKQINFKIPENGLVVFCGNISQKEGVSDIHLFTVRPVQNLSTKLYWCDSTFHLDPLKEMVKPSDLYGIIVIDKREATLAVLAGKKYDIVGHFTSQVAGKTRAGGQSAHRFEQLREEAEKQFYAKVSEKANMIFLRDAEKLKGMIVAGPGATKNDFLNRDMLDYRIKEKILGTLDVSYTDESGIRETLQKSDDLLREAELTRERTVINKFLTEVATNGLAAYGEREVVEAIAMGKAESVLVSEGIEWKVLRIHCEESGETKEVTLKDHEDADYNKVAEDACGSKRCEVIEEVDYLDYMLERAHATGAQVHVVSTETAEGAQFFQSFGGLGALLRYK